MVDLISLFFDYFDDIFIIYSTIFGYAIFFLYFYESEHWEKLSWAERILFGFFIGFITYYLGIGFYAIPVNIYNELFLNHSLTRAELHNVWLLGWIIITLPLYTRIKEDGFPLCKTSRHFWDSFGKNKKIEIFTIVLIFFLIYIFQSINYPYLQYYKKDMRSLLLLTCISTISIYIFIPTIYSNLANPSNIRLTMIIENIFYKKNSHLDRDNILRQIKITLSLGILFFLLITLDSNYGIYTPKILFMEEPMIFYNDVIVTKDVNNNFIPILEKRLFYHIQIPLISNFIPFSIKYIKFKNPNNVTFYDEKYRTVIEESNSYNTDITKNTISVLMKNISKNEIILKLDYYIELDIDKVINIKEDSVAYLHDDKEKTNYSITIENIGEQFIRFDNVKLLNLYEYENIWNYTTDNPDIYVNINQHRGDIIMYCYLNRGDKITIFITKER